MKKVLLVGGCVGLVILAFTILKPEKNIRSGSLSVRSQEFLKEQNEAQNSQWKTLNITPKKVQGEVDIVLHVDKCFSMNIPFIVKDTTRRGECSYSINILEPYGKVIAQKSLSHVTNLSDLPDVMMRRNNREKYKEDEIKINNYSFITFRKITDISYEQTAFIQKDGLYSITLSSDTNENLDEKFDTMIRSIQFP